MSASYIATEYKRHYTQSHRAKQTWVDLSGVRLLRCRTSCCSSRTSPHGRGRSDHRDVHPDQLSCAQFQAIAWPGPVRFRSTCRALSLADVPGYCLSFPGAGCRKPCEMQVVARFHDVLPFWDHSEVCLSQRLIRGSQSLFVIRGSLCSAAACPGGVAACAHPCRRTRSNHGQCDRSLMCCRFGAILGHFRGIFS